MASTPAPDGPDRHRRLTVVDYKYTSQLTDEAVLHYTGIMSSNGMYSRARASRQLTGFESTVGAAPRHCTHLPY